MLPVVALVGRPNVGKSTLFNFLTQTRNALVADFPGLTRDRQYGQVRRGERPFLVVDTGGIIEQAEGILVMCDDVPERGEEFSRSVAEGVSEVMATIEERGRVTAEQHRALDNWESGVSAWIK